MGRSDTTDNNQLLQNNWSSATNQIEEDPFAGLDEDDACDTSLDQLVQQIDPRTTADDYVAADDDLNTCLTFGDTTHWREEL